MSPGNLAEHAEKASVFKDSKPEPGTSREQAGTSRNKPEQAGNKPEQKISNHTAYPPQPLVFKHLFVAMTRSRAP